MPQRWKLENLLHAPAARYDHAAAWDGAQRKLWVHGGWDGLDGFRDLALPEHPSLTAAWACGD